MNVTAVVVAGDRPDGFDTLTPVGGVPMVARAVHCLLASGLVTHVLVLDTRTAVVGLACAGLPVSVRDALFPIRTHAPQRAHPSQGDGSDTIVSHDVILLHDAVRPLAPPALAVAVVDAVRSGSPAAVPVLPLADTVKQVADDGTVRATPDRSTLRVVQTPQAVRRELLDAEPGTGVLTSMVLRAQGGTPAHAVPGHPWAFAVRTAWDLELAELLMTRGGP